MVVHDEILALKGKFHSHITLLIDEEEEVLLPDGWKNTIILLKKGEKTQRDIMLTKHYLTGKNVENVQGILSDMESATKHLSHVHGDEAIVRLKLEYEEENKLTLSKKNYYEVHVKFSLPQTESLVLTSDGWVESRNPMSVKEGMKIAFVNKRFYNGTQNDAEENTYALIEQLKKDNPTVQIVEVKKEITVYDSNLSHDKWWA